MKTIMNQKKAQRGSQRSNVKFVERFRILEEANPIQILPIYANANQKPPVQPRTEEPRARDVPQFRYQDPGCGKICSSSGGLKNHARTHRRDRQYQLPLIKRPASSKSRTKSFLIDPRQLKPQIYLKLAELKTAKFTDNPLTRRRSALLLIPAINQRLPSHAGVLERRSQPINGF